MAPRRTASEPLAASSVSSGSGTPVVSNAEPPTSFSWNRSSTPAAGGRKQIRGMIILLGARASEPRELR